MTPLDLIHRFWVVRHRNTFESPLSVGVKVKASKLDVLWLQIPASDSKLTEGCPKPPKLADLIVLGRKGPVRKKAAFNGKVLKRDPGEEIIAEPGCWRAWIVELKKGAEDEMTAQHAAEQVGNTATLAFANGWPPDTEIVGVIIFEVKRGLLGFQNEIKNEFRNRYGFPLRFLQTDASNCSTIDTDRPDSTRLQQKLLEHELNRLHGTVDIGIK
jgi:hypothetical protein